MNTKDNQRARLTRMLLKQAYLKLMQEGPAAKITVKEICERAQVNRSTFYLHFTQPNDILMELEDETIALIADSVNIIGAQKEDMPVASDYLLVFLRNIQRNDELFRTLLAENSDPHFRRKLSAVALGMITSSFTVDLTDLQKDYVYRFIVSGAIEILIDWIRDSYRMPERDLCTMLFNMCEGCIRNFVAS